MLSHCISFLADSFIQKTNTSWQCVHESKTSLIKPIMCLVIKCIILCPFFILSLLPTSIFLTTYFSSTFFKAFPIQKYKEACIESESNAFVSHLSNTGCSKSFRSKIKTQISISNLEQNRMANLCCLALCCIVGKLFLIHLAMTNVCRRY